MLCVLMTAMPTNLRYGQVQLSAMNWPFFVAETLDFFGEQNLHVERNIFTRPPDPVAALVNGHLDIINVIPDVALLEIVKGACLTIIANTNDRPQYRLLAHTDVQHCGQLEGKRIGVNDGRSAEALIMRRLLHRSGLNPESYELVAAGPPPERCEKLKQGSIAATMVTQPFDFLLEEAGFSVIASSLEAVPTYPFTVCVVRKEQEIDQKFMAFLRALMKAWGWLTEPANRPKAVDILSRATETAPALAERTYELYLEFSFPPSLEPTLEGVATMFDLLGESKRLPSPLPPARRYVDERYFKVLSNEC